MALHRSPLFLFSLLALVVGPLLADPAYYTKGDDWRQTLIAAREGLMAAEAAGTAESRPADGLVLGPWQRIGPFAEPGTHSFDDVAPPETEIKLDAVYGADELRWQAVDYADGVVHNLPGRDESNTYLFRTITAPAARELNGYFGSDDGLAVWLNGEKLISQDVPRGPGANQAQAALKLRAGENQLLLKIHNITGGHGFYFSLDPTPSAADPRAEARAALWPLLARDFPAAGREIGWERAEAVWAADWQPGDLSPLAQRYRTAIRGAAFQAEADQLLAAATTPAGIAALGDLYARARGGEVALVELADFNVPALQRALNDLVALGAEQYPRGPEFRAALTAAATARQAILDDATRAGEALAVADELARLRREILLSNPVLANLNEILFVRRGEGNMGLPQNWQGNTSISRRGYTNEIASLNLRDGSVKTVYEPEFGRFVGNLTLHWDADRLLFSMPSGEGDRWQIHEIAPDGSGYREIGPGDEPDVDNYDACYLPSGKIIFCSTRVFQGVPCVAGGDYVGNLCSMDADGSNVRMLAFDQDHSWSPTVTNDGRVMYTRWEYSDTAHYFTRILFKMNPDGTRQMELYGSNSYWPNSMFYSRALPGDPSKVVTIVSGHHGVARMGELAILDPTKGRRETDGAVQLIPGWGKPVENKIIDELVNNSWPRFLHPFPLSDKYFLVSAKLDPTTPWGLYLVDIFDNMMLLHEEPGFAMLEPQGLVTRPTPPVIADSINLAKDYGTVYVSDIYTGPGLKGIPRGTVKSLRFYEPHYSYNNMGGHINIGIEGPWDVRRIMGTVPVEPDGSISFQVPANKPIAFQPLDEEGRALQMMRSWYTAMPGEMISCVGCHESQNESSPSRRNIAAQRAPSQIQPWRGPVRGFSWKRDVQPQVLDKFCVGCHDGETEVDGKVAMDLRAKEQNGWGNFTPSYIALHPYVRRHGPEGDDRILSPMDFFANTSELIQMLEKGHYGVVLDDEAWDRLYTWIDLNVPDHGTWAEHREIPGNEYGNYAERRLEMRTKYANQSEDPEFIPDLGLQPVAYQAPAAVPAPAPAPAVPGWPFAQESAVSQQIAAAVGLRLAAEGDAAPRRVVDLGGGQQLEFVLIPAGEFVMGSTTGARDEQPATRVRIERPFWMSVTEVTNGQFRRFMPAHDSGFIDQQHKDHTLPGYPANQDDAPAIRVPWVQANDFTAWLSAQHGVVAALPTEAQWEWAARAGTDTPFWYGGLDTDFSQLANLADQNIKLFAVDGVNPQPVANPHPIFQDFVPKDARFNDGYMIHAPAGTFAANPWGLRDMHGNVWEWTRSDYAAYPYVDDDGRNEPNLGGRKVVRGGSWRERPFRATSSFRLGYYTYQPVWDVGFRVILEADTSSLGAIAAVR